MHTALTVRKVSEVDSVALAFFRCVGTLGAGPGPLQDPSASRAGITSRSCDIREQVSN